MSLYNNSINPDIFYFNQAPIKITKETESSSDYYLKKINSVIEQTINKIGRYITLEKGLKYSLISSFSSLALSLILLFFNPLNPFSYVLFSYFIISLTLTAYIALSLDSLYEFEELSLQKQVIEYEMLEVCRP
ncbi:MAG: hypothetical protein A3F40_00185 [Chlamydiae bacterium RIFCSPHIGHO2_12_FULL_27_8]|nr:MAG: hypothetical protein A3F40_00185 [Chlamydiae bacterium RIFCSPHIGHO2_12_FULL_27_8]